MTEHQLWIVVRNWEKFQHYHDRWVPWIKFYLELQHDNDWLSLPIGRRGMLCSIWLEYAQSRCRLPADTRSISRRLNARFRQDDLEALKHAGFLEVCSRPNLEHVKMASRPTRARKEEEKERTNVLQNTLAPKPKPARKKDELWDALVEELEEPATRSERGKRNDAVKQLRDVGATPDEIRLRSARYRQRWPQITFTDQALAKHWTELGKDEPPNGAPPKRRYGRGVTAEEVLERAGIDMKELTP